MIFHSGMQGGLRPHVHSVNTEPFEVNAFKAEINWLFLISRCVSSHQMIGFFFIFFMGNLLQVIVVYIMALSCQKCGKWFSGVVGAEFCGQNFHRNYSSVAAPLHALTSPHVKFQWLPQVDSAFWKPRESFTSGPVCLLDPHLQFVVEADSSDIRIGAIPS